jgi:hypothetical protein
MFNEKIVLSRDLLGCQNHIALYENGKVRVCENFSYDEFSIGNKVFKEGELFDISPIVGIELDHPFSIQLCESYRSIYGDEINWLRALGKAKFAQKISEYLNRTKLEILSKDKRNYLSVIRSGRKILGRLDRISVDENSLRKKLLEKDTTTLRSLIPTKDGLCETVRYSHESQTGRMTVKEGPRVLLLSKEDRKLFRANNPDNVLCQVDFVSLEPRVAYLLCNESAPKDIYTFMGEKIGENISRAQLKIATISSLYGSTKSDPRVSKKINNFFSLETISKKYLQDEEMYNLYGRPLAPENEYVRLSHFVQSTAVDVSLLGFSKFADSYDIIPYFMIHDSLVFECSRETYKNLKNTNDLFLDVEPLGRFYLEFSEFFHDN